MMSKRSLTAAACALALMAAGSARAQWTRTVPVFVNGGRLDENALLLQDTGRTVVPMRALFESLGARVEWDAAQRAVYAWKPDGPGIRLGVGERFAHRMQMSAQPGPGNWGRILEARPLDAPAMIVQERVFVPLRFASEALEANVQYAADLPAVYVRTQAVAGSREEPPVRPPRPEGGVNARELMRSLDVKLVLPAQRFRLTRERGIPLRLTVRNRTDRALVVPMGGQQFDFEVLRDGELVWNWAHDRAFIQILQQRPIRAGEELEFTARWDLTTNQGRRVRPGEYTVRGIFVTAVRNARPADEATITLVE
jgi:hypothetical protein